MYLFKRVRDLQAFLQPFYDKNRPIGFVPTMGALHDGHLSLVRTSSKVANNVCTIASIFVNPTQFNEASDLEKYPRTPADDLIKLAKAGCQAVLMPSVEEVYPPGLDTEVEIDFSKLGSVMEGAHRPGHFDGVAEVVKRLLEIVQPTHLYMGQKDYQQVLIVRKLVETFRMPISVEMCPIVREKDGLAMSSRNIRLTPDYRIKAPLIYKTLQDAKNWIQAFSIDELSQKALSQLETGGLRPEYFQLANAQTLELITDQSDAKQIVACVAAWAGDVRLIDNMII